ncbi:YbaB/EbfC family nucleoid-associated protein [Nocardia sp. NPDC058519]|uniref:YbaB/EbfC family nucleoid-associated protein n=1 Tax=unclassified Nocardia TaxID=2637762 RepID=UPI003658305C
MSNEQAKADLADIIDGVQEQMRAVARIQQARAEITASATVRRRVTVTVNADNKIIETKFGADIEDLGYAEIAKAVTEAAQQASGEVARKVAELMTPFQEQRARMPKISDLVEGMPDFRIPGTVEASMAPPEQRRDNREDPTRRERGSAATDSSW